MAKGKKNRRRYKDLSDKLQLASQALLTFSREDRISSDSEALQTLIELTGSTISHLAVSGYTSFRLFNNLGLTKQEVEKLIDEVMLPLDRMVADIFNFRGLKRVSVSTWEFESRILKEIEELIDHERQFKVLSLSYGLTGGEPISYRDIGELLGISHELARKDLSKAMIKLRKPFFIQYLKDLSNSAHLVDDEDELTFKNWESLRLENENLKKELQLLRDKYRDFEAETIIPITHSLLSNRSYNAIKMRSGIDSLNELSRLTYTEVSNLPGIGRKSVEEVRDILNEYGLDFRKER